MRILITATPGLSATGSVPPLAMGGLDLRTRLAREDAGFDVVFADPDEDLSEQVIDILARRSCGPRDAVMLYIAAHTLLSREGDLYLCLDPEEINIGDALADVAASLRDAGPGWPLIILDLVDARLEADPTRIQTLVRAAEAAIDFASSGIELLVSLRSEESNNTDSSPLVDALISELDAAERNQGLTVRSLFDRVQRKLHGEVAYLHHVRARVTFDLLPLPKGRLDPSVPPPYSSDGRGSVQPAVALLSGSDDSTLLPESGRRRAIIPIPAASAPAISLAEWPGERAPDSEDEWATVDPMLLLGRQFDAPPGASLPPPSASMYPPSSSSMPPPSRTPVAFSSSNTSPPPSVVPASGVPASGIPASVSPSSRLTRGVSQLAKYTVEGELLASQNDFPGAIALFRKALGLLGPSGEPNLRAEMYTRIGELRAQAGDLEDAISDYEKALALRPGYQPALEALIVLCTLAKDWRGVMSAEERLLVVLDSETVRFERMLEFAARWEGEAEKPGRARHLFERAREIQPNNPVLDEQIRRVALKQIMKQQP